LAVLYGETAQQQVPQRDAGGAMISVAVGSEPFKLDAAIAMVKPQAPHHAVVEAAAHAPSLTPPQPLSTHATRTATPAGSPPTQATSHTMLHPSPHAPTPASATPAAATLSAASTAVLPTPAPAGASTILAAR